MRLDDIGFSENVRDQRGRSFGGGGFGGGGGGGIFGLLFGLVLSRFGIGGVLLLALGYCALQMMGGSGGGSPAVAPQQQAAGQGTATAGAGGGSEALQACQKDAISGFSCRVLASTEQTWGAIFQQRGQRYQPATFTFYGRTGQSGCGMAQSAMGPFYCPNDNSIYLDTAFFEELQTRFRAAGDFAQAYVIAHEVGHHIQFLDGTLQRAEQEQRRQSPAQGNAVQVRVELQADCYAGVWAGRNRNRLDPGDIEEGMRAAEAIGDDTLQRQSRGRVAPESFTHGTSAQRMAWLRRGIESGEPASCDTFSGAI